MGVAIACFDIVDCLKIIYGKEDRDPTACQLSYLGLDERARTESVG